MSSLTGKTLLGLLTAWFFFTSCLLGVILWPRPARAQVGVGIPVEDLITETQVVKRNIFATIFEGIETAFSGISSAADTFFVGDKVLTRALKVAWDIIRIKLIKMLVNDIVAWIQGGGKPRFITNPSGFLQRAGDEALGLFGSKLAGVNLCSDFRPAINILIPPVRKFFEGEIACTASQITANMNRIWERDFGQGGWRNWLAIQQPQNNIFGAYFIAQGELADIAARHIEGKKAEFTAGQGFLGQEECAEWGVKKINQETGQMEFSDIRLGKDYNTGKITKGTKKCDEAFVTGAPTEDEFAYEETIQERGASAGQLRKLSCYDLVNGEKQKIEEFYEGEGGLTECTKKQTLTPGAVVARQASDAIGIDIPLLISAKEITEYLGVIVDAIINRVAREGLAHLTRPAGSQTRASAQAPSPFKCERIKDTTSQEFKACKASTAKIEQTAKDPIQIVVAERPLMPQLALDLENFSRELPNTLEKLRALRDVQAEIKTVEESIAATAAVVVAAPRTPEAPITGRATLEDEKAFALPVPDQPLACSLTHPDVAIGQATRTEPALQTSAPAEPDLKNHIKEKFAISLLGLPPIPKLPAISTIGSIALNKDTLYATSTSPVCLTIVPPPDQRWHASPSSTSELEIAKALAATTARIIELENKQILVDGLIVKVKAYRELLDKYYTEPVLGIESGAITDDETQLGLALTAINAQRGPIITDFQSIIEPPSTEKDFPKLFAAFINFLPRIIEEGGRAETITGFRNFPAFGGYFGQLAELLKIERVILDTGAALSCVNPIRPVCPPPPDE